MTWNVPKTLALIGVLAIFAGATVAGAVGASTGVAPSASVSKAKTSSLPKACKPKKGKKLTKKQKKACAKAKAKAQAKAQAAAEAKAKAAAASVAAAAGANPAPTPTPPVNVPTPPMPTPPALTVSSPDDWLGVGSELVFSTTGGGASSGRSVTVHNASSRAIAISSSLSGTDAAEFQQCPGQPTSVPGGGDASVCVQYDSTGNAKHVSKAVLTVTSDEPATLTIPLSGLNIVAEMANNEPNLQQIFSALGYGTLAGIHPNTQPGVPDSPLFVSNSASAVGDEILSPYWEAKDPTKPVNLVPLARYSGTNAPPQFGWYARGTTVNHPTFTFNENQTLMPTPSSQADLPSSGSFGLLDGGTPGGGGSYSDDARNPAGTINPGGSHSFRFYPAKDAAGAPIAGEYLVGLDYYFQGDSAKNWDFQDYVFLLSNAQPDLP